MNIVEIRAENSRKTSIGHCTGKGVLLLITFFGSTNWYAQPVPIEQRLPSVAPHWTQQTYKKVRYEGYSLWVNAFDAAVRQANVGMCDRSWRLQGFLFSLPGANRISIAWRTGSEARYDWHLQADYNVGDVIWADGSQNGDLTVGDVVISVRGIIPAKKQNKIKIAPNLALPNLDAGVSEFERTIARRDPVDGGYFRYRDAVLSPIKTTKTDLATPLACTGQASVSFGGWGFSFWSLVNNTSGIDKSLIDDDPNRYYRGSSIPVFRRFTADVFSEEQARWMIVDQFAADLAEQIFAKIDRDRFDWALRQLESSTAVSLGYPAETEAFGKNWRARAAFLAVYAGLRLNLTEADYISFLSVRDKVVGGGINRARAAVRSDILRTWFVAASQNTRRDRMTSADILDSARLLSDSLKSGQSR